MITDVEKDFTLDMRVNNQLHRNESAELHQLLDIPLEIAEKACKDFRIMGSKYVHNVKFSPDKATELQDAWNAYRKKAVLDLINEAQKHD